MKPVWGALAILAACLPPAIAQAQVPRHLLGTWSAQCSDARAPRLVIAPGSVTLKDSGRDIVYRGVDVSYTYYGGAKATGEKLWLLLSSRPNGQFELIIEAPAERARSIMVDDTSPTDVPAIRSLIAKRLTSCN